MTRASLTQWDARTAQLRWWGWKEARGTRGRCLAVRSCREAAASMAAAPRRDAGTSKGRPGIATPVEVAPWPVFVAEAQRVELSTSPFLRVQQHHGRYLRAAAQRRHPLYVLTPLPRFAPAPLPLRVPPHLRACCCSTAFLPRHSAIQLFYLQDRLPLHPANLRQQFWAARKLVVRISATKMSSRPKPSPTSSSRPLGPPVWTR